MMDFLRDFGFEENSLEKSIPSLLINELYKNSSLVSNNLAYLRDYGIANYQEVFKKYPDMFLMDNEKFENIFSKYDKDDTIAKVEKNITIVEYL